MIRFSVLALVIALHLVCARRAVAQQNPTVPLSKNDSVEEVVRKAVSVRPTPRQLAWQDAEFACFIHFGVNTFTDREWGDGKEDPALFNPTELDARQWVQVCKDAGMRKLVLTAKHHDGFCLWPSQFTEHSVKNSPWKDGKGDVVREVSDACRETGLLFGVYLSPWDRHEPTYGDSPKYNQHFVNQLRELLTQYGDVAEVWFDGACGEGPNGKRQVYDWDAYFSLIRELQSDAVISICGPDVRWCGNEAGDTRASEWSVIAVDAGAQDEDLGSRERLMQAAEKDVAIKWQAAQVDVSIRPGWFYHAAQDGKVKSLDHLLEIYYGSVGGNAELLLNVPPDQRGLIHENDALRLRELGKVLAATYDANLAKGAAAITSTVREGKPEFGADKTLDGLKHTYWTTDDGVIAATIEYDLDGPKTFNRALLQEHLPEGQRVEAFSLDAWKDDDWKTAASATVIGHKRLLRFDDVTTDRVRVRITESRIRPTLSSFGLFYAPPILNAPEVTRDREGNVSISAQPGVEIQYRLGHWPDSAPAQEFTGPLPLVEGGLVKAIVIPPEGDADAYVGSSLETEMEFGIVKTGWNIKAIGGESDAEHAAARAIDDNPETFWQSTSGEKAHGLEIDLGQEYEVTGLTYLPAQETPNGRVVDYAFYASESKRRWGNPAAEGSFDNIVNNPDQRVIHLREPVLARYVRLEARSMSRGVSCANVAELGVLVKQ